MTDYIDRQAAIDALWKALYEYEDKTEKQFQESEDLDVGDWIEHRVFVQSMNDIDRQTIRDLPSAEVEPVKHGRWVPVSERLPEEDTEVLISYRYKEGEGDTSHVDIDITTYGQMYFGGNKVGNNKHWRAPFEYFHSNYEVIAWMPLPEPYKEEAETADEP